MADSAAREFLQETVSMIDRPLPPGWVPRTAQSRREPGVGQSGRVLEGLPGDSPLKQGIIEVIDGARETLCLSSFLFADAELERGLLRAASRGVRVYLLTASEHRLRIETGIDGEVDSRRFEEHRGLLARLAGRILVRTGEDLHAKYVVSDPFNANSRGVLSTANFTTDALAGSLEIGVRLAGAEARDLGLLFSRGFWFQSQHELVEPERLHEVKPLAGGPEPRNLPFTARGKQVLREEVRACLLEESGDIIVSSYGLEKDHDSVRLMRAAAKSGRAVRVLTRRRLSPRQGEAVLSLAESGVKVRAFDNLHAKCIVSGENGRRRALVMSANLEKNGLDQGYEAGVRLSGDDLRQVTTILDSWWEDAPWEFRTDMKRGEVLADVELWSNGRFVHTRVAKESPVIDLGVVEVDSETLLDSARPSKFPEAAGATDHVTLFHRNRYRWRARIRPTGATIRKAGTSR